MATKTNITWMLLSFSSSVKIIAASKVAVMGCIKRPIDPLDADILPMAWVIKNCPPNWQRKANNNRLSHSKFDVGNISPPSTAIGIIEKIQQKKVV